MISFPRCGWLTLRFTRIHRLVIGLERPILPSARKGFPTPASDTPLFGILAVGILLLVPLCAHTPLLTCHSPKQSNPAENRNPSTQQRWHLPKRESSVPWESRAMPPVLLLYRGVTWSAGRGLWRGAPTCGPPQSPCSLFQPSSSPL